jgi:hypothetical protein
VTLMLSLLIPIIAGVLAGAAAGGLLAWYFLRRRAVQPEPSPPPDPWVAAEIDRAAATWASEQGRPEAAPLLADKLHLLHHLSTRRRP